VNVFINHLYTLLGTTSPYNAIADLHTLQITTAHNKPQSLIVFPSRCLVTALKNGDSSVTVLTSLLSDEYPTTELIAPTGLVISPHGPHRKNRSSTVALVSVAARICLLSRCPKKVVFIDLSPGHCISTVLHATV
jgi:hypothetical protein